MMSATVSCSVLGDETEIVWRPKVTVVLLRSFLGDKIRVNFFFRYVQSLVWSKVQSMKSELLLVNMSNSRIINT